MAKKEAQSYTIKVVGEAESPFRGAVPESIDSLIEKPSKNVADLIFSAVKAQVEMCTQAGDVKGAWEAIKKNQSEQFQYSCPLNTFKRDKQNGNQPYQGAHTVFGAFRDGARFVFPEYFYEKGAVGGTKRPSKTHLRKFVIIRPNHIFFYRPDLDGSVITEPDEVEGQQPVGDVKGFARYEVINGPFQFQFTMSINPRGMYEKFLTNQDKVLDALCQGVNHGLGAGRSAGYGMWKIVSTEVV